MKKFLVISLLAAIAASSCRNFMGRRVQGNGHSASREQSVKAFKNIEAEGNVNVYITQGEQKPIKIEGDENLLDYVEIIEDGDRLVVKNRSGFDLHPTDELKVYVTMPKYGTLDASGASDIIAQGKITSDSQIEVRTSGAGNIEAEVDAPKVKADISGSGNIDLKGKTKDVDLDITGAGHAHCYDLMAENTTVDISGVGNAEVFASMALNADVSGAGNISYKGDAAKVEQHVSGVGHVSKVQ